MNIKKLNEELNQLNEEFDDCVSVTYKSTDEAVFEIVSNVPGDWVARTYVQNKSISAYGASKEELIEDIKKKMEAYNLEIINIE